MQSTSPASTAAEFHAALSLLSDPRSPPPSIKKANDDLLRFQTSDINSYLKLLIASFKSTLHLQPLSTAQSQPPHNHTHNPLQLSSLVLIKSLIIQRWKPRPAKNNLQQQRKQEIQFDLHNQNQTNNQLLLHPPQQPPIDNNHNLTNENKSVLRQLLIDLLKVVIILPYNEVPSDPSPSLSSEIIAIPLNVAQTLSVIFGRLAHFDLVNNDFQALLPTLIQHLPSRLFAQSTLNKIVKELSQLKLLAHKKNLSIIAVETFPLLSRMFVQLSNHCRVLLLENSVYPSIGLLIKLKLLVKTLCKMIVSSLPALAKQAFESLSSVFEEIVRLSECLIQVLPKMKLEENSSQFSANEQPIIHLDKILKRMGILLVDGQREHPLEFSPYLLTFLQFTARALDTCSTATAAPSSSSSPIPPPPQTSPTPPPLTPPTPLTYYIISCANFLGNVISCSSYNPDADVNNVLFQQRKASAVEQQHQNTSSSSSHLKTAISLKGDFSSESFSLDQKLRLSIQTVESFYSPSCFRSLAEISIFRLMPLSSDDLSSWSEDAEEFMASEVQATSSDDVRASGQSLYLSLIENRSGKSVLAQLMGELVRDFHTQTNVCYLEANAAASHSQADEKILKWDAIYTAAGISTTIIDDQLQENNSSVMEWFSQCLLPSLTTIMRSEGHTALPVLRHRITWLLGCWVVDLNEAMRPQIYNVLVSILCGNSKSSDAMVKIACVQSLNSICEDWEFMIDAFQPLASRAILGMYDLITFVGDADSRALILQTINVIISRMGTSLGHEAANSAVTPALGIWENSRDQNILRKHVLSILMNVANAIDRADALVLYPVVIPMITAVLGSGNKVYGDNDDDDPENMLHLVEDALKLWLTLMRVAPSYNENLHFLFPKVAELVINNDWEHLRVCMLILESYILIGESVFLTQYSESIATMFRKTIGEVKARAAGYLMLPLETLTRKYPQDGGHLLLEGGVISCIVNCIQSVIRNEHDCEPDICIVQWMSILARAMLGDGRLVDKLFDNGGVFLASKKSDKALRNLASGAMENPPPQDITITAADVVRLYCLKFDKSDFGSVNESSRRRKLWCLFLVSLLPESNSNTLNFQSRTWNVGVLNNLDEVLKICVDVLNEIGATSALGSEDAFGNCAFYDSEEETIDAGKEEYERMITSELDNDAVRGADLKGYVKSRMEECGRVVGEEIWNEIMGGVEGVILKQLVSLVG